MKGKITLVIQSLKAVFSRPAYIILAVIVALIFFFVNLWVANYSLLRYFFIIGSFDFKTRMQILWNPLTLVQANFNFQSLIIVVILSVLLGINFATFIFFLKRRIAVQSAAGLSIFGIIFGFLGIGCSACGSVILSSIFGLSVATVFIGTLPFKGLEFGIFGILALAFSTYLIAKKIQDPIICLPRTSQGVRGKEL